ncbi:MAG TPA: FtsX-like permease family protein, partial [Planctomycetota bacterium]
GLSAVLIGTNKNARHYEIAIWRELNDRRDVQAVRPSTVVREIFSLVGAANNLLRAVAVLVMVVALVGVLVAIYNTMGARRRDFAILRALGARRRTVLGLVMAESAALALLGGAGGLLLAMGGLQLAADRVHELSGVAVRALPAAEDLVVIPAVVLVGALAGLVPALAAYRTEAARYLSGGA